MATKTTNSGNNGVQSKQGGTIKGADCAKVSAANRVTARKQEERLSQARQVLKQTGEFFLKKNEGRTTDIFRLEAGEVGEYAIPGGDQPSVHLCVVEAGTPEKPFRVVYFESAHEKSGLPGNMSTETYLPIWTLSKDSFQSRMLGHSAETQNKLFGFLTGVIDNTRAEIAKNKMANELADMVSKSTMDLRGIKHGKIDSYAITKGEGVAVLSVFMAKHLSVTVLRSTIAELPATKAFLPIKLLGYNELRQVTTDDIYAGQLAIYSFLKPILDNLVEDVPKKVSKPTPPIVVSVVTPAETLTTPVVKEEPVVMINVKKIMNGAVGVTIFKVGEQSLTVDVHDKSSNKGPVRFFEVIEKSGFVEGSPSIEIGTYVTSEQLIASAISKADQAGLPSKSIQAKEALVAFIVKAIRGTSFCKKSSKAILPKAPSLKLVA